MTPERMRTRRTNEEGVGRGGSGLRRGIDEVLCLKAHIALTDSIHTSFSAIMVI
jgi:hypothetical protein